MLVCVVAEPGFQFREGARLEVNIKKKKKSILTKKKSITTISVIQKLIKRKL